jgi:hypothetical protein
MTEEAPSTPLPPPYAYSYGATASAASEPPEYGDQSGSDELPPSYDSLYGQVRAAKAQSSGISDFLKKFFVIIFSTIYCTVVIGIFLAIPVSMIVMGSVYFNDCPCEPFIPLYLVVGGCFGVLRNLSSMVQRIKNKRENRNEENAHTNPFDGIVGCFLVAWFIAGNVWIYRTQYKLTYTPGSPWFCDYTLYWYSFWLITSVYIVAAVSCCCFCASVCICSFLPQSAD